jgi:hypothetical protein
VQKFNTAQVFRECIYGDYASRVDRFPLNNDQVHGHTFKIRARLHQSFLSVNNHFGNGQAERRTSISAWPVKSGSHSLRGLRSFQMGRAHSHTHTLLLSARGLAGGLGFRYLENAIGSSRPINAGDNKSANYSHQFPFPFNDRPNMQI